MNNETAQISQDMLEKFVNGKYHWKGLTPTAQMAMARELLKHRAFTQRLRAYSTSVTGVIHANQESDGTGQS